MNMSTLLISLFIFVIATIVYVYYTLWVYYEPFLDSSNPNKKYFPLPRFFKFLIPGVLLAGIISAGVFLVSYANKLKNKKKAAPAKDDHTKKD